MSKKTKKLKKTKSGSNVLVILIFTIIGLFLLYNFCLTTYKIYQKKNETKKLNKEMIELKDKQDELEATVSKFQDPDYVARYAREKYLYSKNGEIIIKFPNK